MSSTLARPSGMRPLVAALILATAAGLQAQADYTSYADNVVEKVLDNGLRLLVLERHNAPVVSVHTYVDVGSVDEHVGITGVAHMMEHMAFKGTDLIGTTDFARESKVLDRIDQVYMELQDERNRGADADDARIAELERAFTAAQEEANAFIVDDEWSKAISSYGGVGLNASTSWDSTNYFVSLPSQFLEAWILLESERFQFPVFREFYKERDVVKEERRMRTEDRAFGKLIELHLATCFTAHPYHQPTIGYMSDLDNLSRPVGEAFFETHYHPGNMIVSIVGDVDATEVVGLVEKYFGDIPPGPARRPVHTIEPEQQGQRRVEYVSTEQPAIFISYHKPGAAHDDTPVYDALTEILAGGRTSRLYRKLVDEKKIALAAGAFGSLPGEKYPNLFTIYAIPMKGEDGEYLLDECEAAVFEEIVQLQRDLVTEAELERVKTNARASFIRSLSSNAGLARALSTYEAIHGDWRNLFTEVNRIEAVTLDDLRRVARSTLVETNSTVSRIVPPRPPAWESEGTASDGDAGDSTEAPKRERREVEPPPALEDLPAEEPAPQEPAPQEPRPPEPSPQEPARPTPEEPEKTESRHPPGQLRPGMLAEPGFGVERPSDEMLEKVNALIDRLNIPAERKPARDEIIALGKEATPVLMMRRNDPSFTVRWEFVNIMGYIVDARGMEAVVENVLRDPNPHVRWRGMWALSEFPDRGRLLELYEAARKDPDPVVVWNACVGLSMRGFDDALDEIHAGLSQSDSWRRWEAINALSRVWNSESSAALEQILTSGSDRERQETVMSLGKIADEKAAELLIRALDDPRPGVRWRACMGLVRIRDERAREPLERLLATDTDEDVERFARQALDALPRAAPATDEAPVEPEKDKTPEEAGPGEEE